MSRYARQMQLPQIGEAGQAQIAAAHVLVIGAGGLAAPALPLLAGAGVGRITLVDGDVVSLSNLHRQTLFHEADVGRPKVAVAAERLRALNSACVVETRARALTPADAPELVAGATVVLDCADSFAASYVLSDTCLAAGVPLVSASVLGTAGYVGGFCGGAPSLRAVFPDLPDRAATCASAGVMGPVVGLIGAAQAQMALAVILGTAPSPLGQLLSFDMGGWQTGGFRFDGAAEPDAPLRFVDPAALLPSDFVVDLRNVQEAPRKVRSDALRLDVVQFRAASPAPAPDQRAVLACRSGLRAWTAASHLKTYWPGEICLLALGDTSSPERTS